MVIDLINFLAKAMKGPCLTAKTASLGRLFQGWVVEQVKYQDNW